MPDIDEQMRLFNLCFYLTYIKGREDEESR